MTLSGIETWLEQLISIFLVSGVRVLFHDSGSCTVTELLYCFPLTENPLKEVHLAILMDTAHPEARREEECIKEEYSRTRCRHSH